jgi:hypothetical protein
VSVEKTLEKLLRGASDANIRFDEICDLLQAKGFRMRVSGSHHISPNPASWSGSIFSVKVRRPSPIK